MSESAEYLTIGEEQYILQDGEYYPPAFSDYSEVHGDYSGIDQMHMPIKIIGFVGLGAGCGGFPREKSIFVIRIERRL